MKKIQDFPEEILLHAKSCKNCKKECMQSNPLGVDIPKIYSFVKQKKFEDAAVMLFDKSPLPSVHGKLCFAKSQEACPNNLPISLMVHAVSNVEWKQSKPRKRALSVAIVGGGLAGLAAANIWLQKGARVSIFESHSSLGGSLIHFIPDHRLPRDVVHKEILKVSKDANISLNTLVGVTTTLEDISGKFDVVLVATGANKPLFPGISGEHLKEVYTVNDILIKGMPSGSGTVVVIGGNSSAIDSALLARRAGYDVIFTHSGQIEDLPCDFKLIRMAQREGVQFFMLTDVTRVIGERDVVGIECRQMMFGDEDEDGKRVILPIEGSEFQINCDKIILATGFDPNQSIKMYTKLRTLGRGRVWVNQFFQTTIPNVFAAGEIVLGHSPIDSILKNVVDVSVSMQNYILGKLPKGNIEQAELN